MNLMTDYTNILVRYDLKRERGTTKIQASVDEALQKIIESVVDGDAEAVENAVNKALETKDPLAVVDSLVKGMDEVGRLWDEGTYYLPQVILASDAMLGGIDLCEKKLGKAIEKKGTVVCHVAEGDIHDIGLKIVTALLRANGYEVVDLGKDVLVDDVIEAVKKCKPAMVTGTALMTTTMTAFERISEKLLKEGISIPFICGGGAVSEEYVTGFELGIYGKDAALAPAMAADAVSGMTWKQMREKYNG